MTMNCAFCGKPCPKKYTKYCSKECARKNSSLAYLLRNKKKEQENKAQKTQQKTK